ncbi:MAG: 1-acyl-sn-glycerol-3-phosphate acyltransferase [Deltaproteobacteria bacterium]|jgi:glycerol-3-phosphate dehydrogenase/1-acyl-sn-glycerol-3-phosphate acyltransferase|nr:1-acyl-sn-glycerol-3-phosphate acyltransferase [Deltaproteobacteria bacterium]
MNFLLKSVFKRLDFVKAARYLASKEPGRSYLANVCQTGAAYNDQDKIAALAVELTARALEDKGDPANRQELTGLVDLISCRYDAELHGVAKAACFNLISHLFESRDLNRLFVSRDQRELRFLPRLQKAQAEGLGVVYLINHSSHWDEFIFNVFLDQNGLNLPLFAAGQNMMATPSLSTMLMLGSYVIVRKGASRAYLAALFHYCQALAEMGKPQGIFLEAWSGGARTRDGSLRYPRRLVTIQGALAARGDVLVQPVVISYSRVPEDRDLSEGQGLWSWLSGHQMWRELLKNPFKPVRSLTQGLKNLYGRTYVAFAESRLLSELRTEWEAGPKDLALDEFATLFAIREIAKDKKIMATQVAASALDPLRRNGGGSLFDAGAHALNFIRDYHHRVFGQDPDFEDFIRERPLAEALLDGLDSLDRREVIAPRFIWSKRPPKILAQHALSYYATHGDRRLYSPSAKENLVVCGAGPWGFAVVTFIGRRTLNDKKFHNSSLTLYDPSEAAVQALADRRALPGFDFRLPKNVFPTWDHTAAFRKASEVIVAVPPEETNELFKTIFASVGELKTLILASRGFDRISHRLTIQMAWEAAVAAGRPETNILALSGPFSPADILFNRGGFWILAGPARPGRQSESSLFKYGPFQVYLSDDPIGVQTAAALIDAYALYGAYLHHKRELRTPIAMANFVREVSAEAKKLAMALGGQPATFESDSPAWISEFIAAALTGPTRPTVKTIVARGLQGVLELQKEKPRELWPDLGIGGYYSIHSAYLVAKNLSLSLPHLETANRTFWG